MIFISKRPFLFKKSGLEQMNELTIQENYRKVASSNMSPLEARAFSDCLWRGPFGKKLIS